MAKKKKSVKIQFFEYMLGGGAFFWSGYAAFAVFDGIFHLPLFVAKQGANLIGLTVNFIIQDRVTFRSRPTKNQPFKRRDRYILLTIANLGIDYAIVAGLNEVGITPYLGQFASAGFFAVWNFLWYKNWVFAPAASPRSRKKKAVRRQTKWA